MVLHGTRQVSYGDQRQKGGHSPERLDKFDNLTTLVESLLQGKYILPYGYETTEQKLEDKCSVTEAVKLDSR